jgi:hypothetical protein
MVITFKVIKFTVFNFRKAISRAQQLYVFLPLSLGGSAHRAASPLDKMAWLPFPNREPSGFLSGLVSEDDT